VTRVSPVHRREFCKTAAALCAVPAIAKPPHPAAIHIEEVTHSYQDFHYRAPYKFGGFAVDRVTLLNVECVVSLPSGRSAKGFGSMTMGNIWSFPSHVLTYDQTLGAMKALAEQINTLTRGCREYGHPIDLNFTLEPYYLAAASQVTRDLGLAEPIRKLCTLVTASPSTRPCTTPSARFTSAMYIRHTAPICCPMTFPNTWAKNMRADGCINIC
jgi:hypothetical protein